MPKLGFYAGAGELRSPGASDKGVVVTAIAEGGVAADHGLQVGDVILDVGGKPVATPAEFRKTLSDARKDGKHTVLFRVKSGGGHEVCRPAARQRLSNGAIRRHLSPPLAGVPWGRAARPVPAEYQLCLPVSVAPAGVELVEGVAGSCSPPPHLFTSLPRSRPSVMTAIGYGRAGDPGPNRYCRASFPGQYDKEERAAPLSFRRAARPGLLNAALDHAPSHYRG